MQAKFRLFETESYLKDLESDFGGKSFKIKLKLADVVYSQIRQNPYFGKNIKKLRNYEPETWRYRVGDFRFFYSIDDRGKTILMIAADNRADAY